MSQPPTAPPAPDTMEAGRAMDMRIAETVMGWKRGVRYGNGNGEWIVSGQAWPTTWEQTPRFSTDDASALLVLEKMRERFSFGVWAVPDISSVMTGYDVAFARSVYPPTREVKNRGIHARADTLALAISRAALKAVQSLTETSHG